MDPKVAAQEEAEKTFEQFIVWTKRVTMYSAFFLCVVVFACNNGVETGKGKSPNTMANNTIPNLNVKDK